MLALMPEDTERIQQLKDDFVERGGYWLPALDALFRHAPDFAEDYIRFAAVPLDNDRLGPGLRALIQLAVSASTTHLHGDAVRHHIRSALQAGTTRAEIVEVLKLTSVLGIHTCTLGVPALLEELQAFAADGSDPAPLDAGRQALKDRFIADRGYWNPVWDGILALDPVFFDAFTAFSANPWRTGPLPPKVKELVYIAIDTATTHLFELGTHIHIARALRHGATRGEILEVLQLVSVLGIHTCALALPILDEELAAQARSA